uniref:Uncharacterized protein n=1 Tax=Arundo donax TaxID=35708 RepID=A0A0A9FD66_ARUDO
MPLLVICSFTYFKSSLQFNLAPIVTSFPSIVCTCCLLLFGLLIYIVYKFQLELLSYFILQLLWRI